MFRLNHLGILGFGFGDRRRRLIRRDRRRGLWLGDRERTLGLGDFMRLVAHRLGVAPTG
jgi:hypothetical protein